MAYPIRTFAPLTMWLAYAGAVIGAVVGAVQEGFLGLIGFAFAGFHVGLIVGSGVSYVAFEKLGLAIGRREQVKPPTFTNKS